jgi:uncharacterized protein YggE
MKAMRLLAVTILAAAVSGVAMAADSNSYQVTGPILSVTPTTITIQKDADKWEIARDAATPVKGGELKVGTKVTVKYRMTAISIDVKDAKK